MPGEDNAPYVLGIDLGSASLGWAAVTLDRDGNAVKLLGTGVRVFDPGVAGSDLDIQQGKDESKSVKRRQMRLQRRQLRRRAARQRDLFELLQAHGLLPAYPQPFAGGKPHVTNAQKSAARHDLLKDLDQELAAKWKPRMAETRGADHVLPYFLRAQALDSRLEPYELGRALYNLGQRRGFLSNRKQTSKPTKEKGEEGKAYGGISALQEEMAASGARSLGEHFSKLDPTAGKRIRQRYTHRDMFKTEFERIWQTQSAHAPGILTPELKGKIERLLFWQRPIARQTHLIGGCELETGHKRAPLACLDAQRFRLLQKVNDLRVRFSDFTERPLRNDERARLMEALETQGELTFAEVRHLLGLPKRAAWFNLERGGEKKIPGNRTASKMRAAFGKRWDGFSKREQEQIVEDWSTAETEEWLVRRGMNRWGLEESAARVWAGQRNGPEDGYSRLSRKALARLLPLMERGLSFKEAEKQVYDTHFSGGQVHPTLPPLRKALPALRNPAAERALTELRKVVNAIVREYGKPCKIHVELARDLKNPRAARVEIWKAIRERQNLREKKKEQLLKEIGIAQPSRDDVERLLLWEECNHVCPYTGRTINLQDLFGALPQFDVEHILPFKRCPDNSFANKTLCYSEENTVKHNRTPWEAYGADAARWEEILNRVQRFKRLAGPQSPGLAKKGNERKPSAEKVGVPGKVKRFLVKTQEELASFSNRRLQDTRYVSKLAAQYLGLLYGGRDELLPDGTNRQRVFASPGALTAELRRNWGLEEILREPESASSEGKSAKPRGDHRHHAIDALVIALTSPAAIKAMSDAAERNAHCGRTSIKGIEAPWPDFVPSIRPHIESLVVSHRPERKLGGQLHDETLYSAPYEKDGKTCVHVRKPLHALTKNEIKDIVDPAVQEAVRERVNELGDLKKLQTAGVEPPFLQAADGRRIPIRRVRIRKALTVTPVGEDARRRHVAPNNNHHMEIIAELHEKEREVRWDGVPVSLLEAMERQKKGEPIVRKSHGLETQYRFKFSLMGKDTIEIPEGERAGLYVVRTIASNGQIALARTVDARIKDEIRKSGDWWSPRADALRRLNARKVVVDVLGKVHPAND